MKPLPDKDGNTAGQWDSMYRFHPGTAVTHTRNRTPSGPDFCQECSDAAADWVRWPCGKGDSGARADGERDEADEQALMDEAARNYQDGKRKGREQGIKAARDAVDDDLDRYLAECDATGIGAKDLVVATFQRALAAIDDTPT